MTIRNPRTVSYEDLRPKDVAYDANGNPIDPEQFRQAMYKVYDGLIVNCHAYDATALGDEQPLIEAPGSGVYAKLPSGIQDVIVKTIEELKNPTMTPAT